MSQEQKEEEISQIPNSSPTLVDEKSFPKPPAKTPSHTIRNEEWIPPSAEGGPTIAEMFQRLEDEAPQEVNAIRSLKDLMILFGEY